MNFHILTLFPDMVENGLKTSITGRAIESGAISVEAVDIRDYTTDKHRHVDDAPYGGGAAPVFFGGSLYALRRLFERKALQNSSLQRSPNPGAESGSAAIARAMQRFDLCKRPFDGLRRSGAVAFPL